MNNVPRDMRYAILDTQYAIRASALYICRERSTNQLFLCKTNPILSAVGGLQMHLSAYLKMSYENKHNWTLGENKPNSNPIQTQNKPNSRKAEIDAKRVFTKDYQEK
jgi:hypothetical protein